MELSKLTPAPWFGIAVQSTSSAVRDDRWGQLHGADGQQFGIVYGDHCAMLDADLAVFAALARNALEILQRMLVGLSNENRKAARTTDREGWRDGFTAALDRVQVLIAAVKLLDG